jgi:hypothetical protein
MPGPRSAHVRPVSRRAKLEPEFGGETMRLNRKGSRYAMDVELPPLTYAESLAWTDLEEETATVVMEVPQPGVNTGLPGAGVVVDGDDQAGTTLRLRAVTPGYVFRKGWYLSVSTGGFWFLYRSRATAMADADGVLEIPLRTMLREPHADGDVVELRRPVIEGFATYEGAPIEVTQMTELRFTIEERA